MQQRKRGKLASKLTEWKDGKVINFEVPMFIGCVVASLIFVSCESKAHNHEIEIPQYQDILKVENVDTTTMLSLNLFHESRGESDLANMMVLATVFNRASSDHYPNTVEDVIKQKYQFSWTNDGKSDAVGHNSIEINRYKELYKLTEQFILEKQNWLAVSMGVNHYHRIDISPKWSKQ